MILLFIIGLLSIVVNQQRQEEHISSSSLGFCLSFISYFRVFLHWYYQAVNIDKMQARFLWMCFFSLLLFFSSFLVLCRFWMNEQRVSSLQKDVNMSWRARKRERKSNKRERERKNKRREKGQSIVVLCEWLHAATRRYLSNEKDGYWWSITLKEEEEERKREKKKREEEGYYCRFFS